MAQDPHFPADTAVGKGGETLEAAQSAKRTKEQLEARSEADKQTARSRTRNYAIAGAAVGVGSAALVAALLYARNRNKAGDKKS